MSNLTEQEERFLPLTEEKYGPYLNETLKYFEEDEHFGEIIENMSDLEKAIFVTEQCKHNRDALTFDKVQLFRVIFTWTLFFISAVGNIFVLLCVCRKSRTSHVHLIMLHFAIADLAFTFLVLPEDALWNTTMQWYGSTLLCKICQMGKQIGMYISSFMVVVISLDRCCGILQPMCTIAKQRRRTKYLVVGAWILCIVSAIPPAILFSVEEVRFCPDTKKFRQCIDSARVKQDELKPYYFFTMAMSFILPMILCTVFYSLVICEITNMMQRDRAMMGRRDSAVSITRARKKTLKMSALVTLTFLVFWGPYYAYGIYYWFTRVGLPKEISAALLVVVYVHPAIHPFIYGILMKDVRDAFRTLMLHLEKIITCSATEAPPVFRKPPSGTRLSCGDASLTCLQSQEGNPYSRTNGYSHANGQRESSSHVTDGIVEAQMNSERGNEDDRGRLISVNSDPCSGGSEDALTPLANQRTVDNGTKKNSRTSQVSFKLPESNEVQGSAGLNNNNKEVEDGRRDQIFQSTDI